MINLPSIHLPSLGEIDAELAWRRAAGGEPVLVLHPNQALPLAPVLPPGSWVLNEKMPIACGCLLPDGVVECSFHKSPLAMAEDVGDLPELVRLAARLELVPEPRDG